MILVVVNGRGHDWGVTGLLLRADNQRTIKVTRAVVLTAPRWGQNLHATITKPFHDLSVGDGRSVSVVDGSSHFEYLISREQVGQEITDQFSKFPTTRNNRIATHKVAHKGVYKNTLGERKIPQGRISKQPAWGC